MKLTPNLNLKKPDYTDAVDIKDINDNMDAIDTELNKKAAKTEFDEHKADVMPHMITDLRANKKYRYGYQVSPQGIPQIISEEVI